MAATEIVVKHHDGTRTLVDLDPTDLASISRLADVVRRNRPHAEDKRTTSERRNEAYIIALQTLYYVGHQQHGRLLDKAEMDAAMDTASAFIDHYFGKPD